MATQPFKHSPLPPGQWFRLLNVLPGSREDPIECELLTIELDAAPDYEPISYVWGDPTMSHEIICDGCSLFITKHLFQALRRFRRQVQPRVLWADGICINQNDEAEKSSQVSFMSKVYENGYQTLVWLGEDDEHENCTMTDSGCAETSFALIKQFIYTTQSQLLNLDRSVDENIYTSLSRISSNIAARVTLWQEKNRRQCMKHFFDRVWFSRTWVINEVGLSRRATAFVGSSYIAWNEIVLCAAIYSTGLWKHEHGNMEIGKITDTLMAVWATAPRQDSWLDDKNVWMLRQLVDHAKVRVDPSTSSLDILNVSRRHLATQPHDHVFAFLGHPFLRGVITPDYSWSLSELHQRLAEQLMYRSQRLDLLSFVVNEDDDLSLTLPIPSWIPQWHKGMRGSKVNKAWNGIVAPDETIMEVSQSRLSVAALLVGGVGNHSAQLAVSDFKKKSDKNKPHILQNLYAMQQDAQHAPTTDKYSPRSSLGVFLWTIAYGLYVPGCDIHQDFLAWSKDHPKLYDLASQNPHLKFQGTSHSLPSAERFTQWMHRSYGDSKFFTTLEGTCGLGPPILRMDDVLAVVFGCSMPLLLRPTGPSKTYKVVGSCYVYGLMDDDEDNYVAKRWRNGSLLKETIYLV